MNFVSSAYSTSNGTVASAGRSVGVAVQNVERSRTSKVSGSCQRLAVNVSASWSLCREMARTRARWKL